MLTRLRCWLASNASRKPRTDSAGCADELTFVPENEIDVVLVVQSHTRGGWAAHQELY